MTPSTTPSIPKGSTVLVTGANGFVGSHVVNQFLFQGFRVRGTVGDVIKHAWLTKMFEKKYGIGNFELVSVPNMAANGAFDDVVRGVSAVIHTASVLTMNPDPNKMFPDSVAGAVAALKAAYSEPGVKRFVFTSSSAATAWLEHGQPTMTITEGTWNDAAVEAAWVDPPYEPQRAPIVYAASKTQAEQEIWKFHGENRLKHPELIVNTVLPSVIFGKSLDRANQGYPSSSGLPVALWEGNIEPPHMVLAPQYFVNVQDVARLHIAGATLPEVRERRIFAFAEHFSWDSILEIMRRHSPEREFIGNFSGGQDTVEITPRTYAERLLRDLGELGWTSLQDTMLEIIKEQYEIEHISKFEAYSDRLHR